MTLHRFLQVDVREIGDDSRLATIFGRDAHGAPHKWTVVCTDTESCKLLVTSVNQIVHEHEMSALRIGTEGTGAHVGSHGSGGVGAGEYGTSGSLYRTGSRRNSATNKSA